MIRPGTKEVIGENYLHRWTILDLFGWRVYLHHFVGDDKIRPLHDHPCKFWSIGLWGNYVEQYVSAYNAFGETTKRLFKAPWFRTFPAIHRHRIIDVRNTWALVVHGPPKRRWGFYPDGIFVYWKDYLAMLDSLSGADD